MKLISIKPSTNKDKKLMATFERDNGRQVTTHFGASEDWNDVTSAGALSRWILWNKPTIEASKADFKKRFNL